MSHPEALEVLYWHDMYAIRPERSDEAVKAQRRRFNISYKTPAPLNLSDQQVVDWMEEMRPEIEWEAGDDYVLSGARLIIREIGIQTFGKTLKDAVCLAAAKWKEMNE